MFQIDDREYPVGDLRQQLRAAHEPERYRAESLGGDVERSDGGIGRIRVPDLVSTDGQGTKNGRGPGEGTSGGKRIVRSTSDMMLKSSGTQSVSRIQATAAHSSVMGNHPS